MSGPVNGRSSHVAMPASYAAVGASKAPDLLRFPPEGSTSYEEVLKLGSGQERFIAALSLLMTWGAQRGAGIEVGSVVRGEGDRYVGIVFDSDGAPTPADGSEDHFGPDGEPYLTAGTTAVFTPPQEKAGRAVMVVYTVDEPRRAGFAWGTSDDEGAVGEELLTVEHRDDDTVWAVARGFFSPPKNGLLGVKGRAQIKAVIASARAELRSLAPGAAGDTADVTDTGDSAVERDGGGAAGLAEGTEGTGVAASAEAEAPIDSADASAEDR